MLGVIGALLSRRNQVPADRVTRVPRRAAKPAAGSVAAMRATLDKISALTGIADVKETKRVPKGFYELVAEFLRHVDAYHETLRERMGLKDVKRPGEPGGTAGCYAGPMGLSSLETLNLYRTARTWRDFPDVAKRMAELGEQQFKDIQAGHSGKDPEKIRMGGKAVRQGRITFAKRMLRCPMLDESKQRCRIWDERPMVCRMHHPTTPPQWSQPDHDKYPTAVEVQNLRLPLKIQAMLAQLDKRTTLQLSPLMYAGILQLLQLSDGNLVQEVGEAPQRMQQDGMIAPRANRNVRHAKKFKKKRR
jgi:Fe-S-cluster containining protein